MSAGAVAAADRDALAVALVAAHEALDRYGAAVLAAADAHTDDDLAAWEDPALVAAYSVLADAVMFDLDEAADRVLGVTDEESTDDLQHDPEAAVGVELYATVIGPGQGEPLLLVDAEGEKLIDALEAAGFEVPEWGVRLVPVEHLDKDFGEDDDDA